MVHLYQRGRNHGLRLGGIVLDVVGLNDISLGVRVVMVLLGMKFLCRRIGWILMIDRGVSSHV
jgi:hypothetical protein